MGFGHWLSNSVATAGKAAGSMAHLVHDASGVVATVAATNPELASQLHIPPEILDAAKGISTVGSALVAASPILSAAAGSLPKGVDANGFAVAIQLLRNPVSEALVTKVRESLAPAARLAFDVGVSAHIGQVAHVAPHAPPAIQAAYLITKGAQGATPAQKVAIVGALASDPRTRPGAALAIKDVASAREGWFARFLHWLGLRP